MSSWGAGLLFNIPQSPPTVKGAIRRPALLQNPGSFLKQDVCLRPPSPQINNPQNLILGDRVEALESHYFHIPYPGALGLLRECGRPGAGKAQACSGNLRPFARLQGEMRPDCITLGSVWKNWGSCLNHIMAFLGTAESVCLKCCNMKNRRETWHKHIPYIKEMETEDENNFYSIEYDGWWGYKRIMWLSEKLWTMKKWKVQSPKYYSLSKEWWCVVLKKRQFWANLRCKLPLIFSDAWM